MVVKVNLPDYSNLVELATERATKIAVSNLQEEAVETAPKDTGNYARNIVADFNKDEVRAEANYSRALEYGLPPREIRVRNAKALRFEVDGKVVYSKSAKLPATKPQPTLRLAARKIQKNIPSIYKRELEKVK